MASARVKSGAISASLPALTSTHSMPSAPRRRWLIDGALTTNDPSLCAITESLAMGHDLDDIWMVSLGTGHPVHDLSQDERDAIGEASRDWGIVGWIANGLLDYNRLENR